MKSLLLKISLVAMLFSGMACNLTNGKETKTTKIASETAKIEVYYFHYTRRCETCMAVENVTKETLQELYAKNIENGSIIFKAVNLDEAESESLAEKLEISGQTLLVVYGDKKENITTDAFMNAKSNPDKLKEIIKSKIDPLLDKL